MTRLQDLASEHLLLHFTDMPYVCEHGVQVLARGEGVHVFDEAGRRYIDGLSGLYCTNLGHSYGEEIGQAALAQMRELPFTPNWTVAHPRSIELAARLAQLAPPALNRAFFTSGGSESVESAYKLARQFHQANGQHQRVKVIARDYAYHGTTLGALSFTGIPVCRTPFEPLAVPTRFVANTNAYRHPDGDDEARFCRALLDEIEAVIEFEAPETIAMLIAEPVQNAGGCLVPPAGYWEGLRELCDRHGILLVSDEVICGFGRLGEWFGAQRLGYEPDMITFAKGLTAAHAAMGGVLVADRVAAPFLDGRADYLHGVTFGGHPVGAAVALAVIGAMERDGVLDNVRANEAHAARALEPLRELPIVGDLRGIGHFWALELVADKATRRTFEGEEADFILRDVLSERLFEHGLICRLDDRADPIVQLAPPLVAEAALFDEIAAILADALEYAWARARELPSMAGAEVA